MRNTPEVQTMQAAISEIQIKSCTFDKRDKPGIQVSHLTPIICDGIISIGSEMLLRGKSVRSWLDWSSDRSFTVDPLSYFSFQPESEMQLRRKSVHSWCDGSLD